MVFCSRKQEILEERKGKGKSVSWNRKDRMDAESCLAKCGLQLRKRFFYWGARREIQNTLSAMKITHSCTKDMFNRTKCFTFYGDENHQFGKWQNQYNDNYMWHRSLDSCKYRTKISSGLPKCGESQERKWEYTLNKDMEEQCCIFIYSKHIAFSFLFSFAKRRGFKGIFG